MTPRPLLTIEEFFEGNEVAGSICCNCIPVPEPAEVRAVLEAILARPGVESIRIQVSIFDDEEWPFSNMVWIVTSVEPHQLAGWFPESMRPDEIWEGWNDDVPCERLDLPPGMNVVGCFWD